VNDDDDDDDDDDVDCASKTKIAVLAKSLQTFHERAPQKKSISRSAACDSLCQP